MSQKDEIQAIASELASGLKKLGPNRTVALSVHVSKELIAELEEKANTLIEKVSALNS
tara:strand:+ start:227 stop:400 length:174 start_codon:yes stop_codon:yes gene_type:complete